MAFKLDVLYLQQGIDYGDEIVPQPPQLHLSAANIGRSGAFLMDCYSEMYLWVGSAVDPQFCLDVFGVQSVNEIEDGLVCCM